MSDFHESGPEIPKPQQYNSDDYAHRIPEAIARIEYNIRLAVLAEDISKMFMEQKRSHQWKSLGVIHPYGG